MITTLPLWQKIINERNLDASVVEVQDLEPVNLRMDAEFYAPHFIKLEKVLYQKPTIEFKNFTTFIKKGIFDISPKNYVYSGGVPFLRSGDMKDEFISGENIIQINQEAHEKEIRTELNKGDLVLSKVGTIGDVAVNYNFEKLNLSQNVIGIKIQKSFASLSGFFMSFLNSKFGKLQIDRKISGYVQEKLTLEDIRNIKIPISSQSFQQKIADMVLAAFGEREKAKALQKEAENILLEELNLKDWRPSGKNWSIKQVQEARIFGRLDGEFFQPKYDELFEKIQKFQVKSLGEIIDYQKGVEPGSDVYCEKGAPFVRVADVSERGIGPVEKNIPWDFFEKYKKLYSPQKDDIIFTKDGTIGISFVIKENLKMILSGAFLRLISKIPIQADYLVLVLNSIICKMQIERFSGGALIAHLKPSDAMTLKIPILSQNIQTLIAQKINVAQVARENSKSLLQKAKRAIEIFIEKDEKEALDFIQK